MNVPNVMFHIHCHITDNLQGDWVTKHYVGCIPGDINDSFSFLDLPIQLEQTEHTAEWRRFYTKQICQKVKQTQGKNVYDIRTLNGPCITHMDLM